MNKNKTCSSNFTDIKVYLYLLFQQYIYVCIQTEMI